MTERDPRLQALLDRIPKKPLLEFSEEEKEAFFAYNRARGWPDEWIEEAWELNLKWERRQLAQAQEEADRPRRERAEAEARRKADEEAQAAREAEHEAYVQDLIWQDRARRSEAAYQSTMRGYDDLREIYRERRERLFPPEPDPYDL